MSERSVDPARAKREGGGEAHLGVVHAEHLVLDGGAEVQPGDAVEAGRDERGDDERVRGARDDVRELDVELLPVVVQPAAARARVDAVERDDRAVGEEAVEEQADHPADRVFGAQVCERERQRRRDGDGGRVRDAHPVHRRS